MSYEIVNPIPQFNFQINRVLTYGELACSKGEVIGTHITGTKTPYEFFQSLSLHDLAPVTELLTQDILLLAGEEDHYIPPDQFYRLKASICHARSLTCRLFTRAEGGEQHCQIGDHRLAINEISDWLDCLFLQRQR